MQAALPKSCRRSLLPGDLSLFITLELLCNQPSGSANPQPRGSTEVHLLGGGSQAAVSYRRLIFLVELIIVKL